MSDYNINRLENSAAHIVTNTRNLINHPNISKLTFATCYQDCIKNL